MLEREENKISWGILEFVMALIGLFLFDLVYAYLFPGSVGSTSSSSFALGYLARFAATIAIVWLLVVVVNKASWGDLGVKKTSVRSFLLYGLLGGVLILVLILAISIPINYLQPNLQPQDYERMLRAADGGSQLFVILFIGVVLAPLREELMFRGMLYPAIRQYLGPWGGAIVAGIIFGLIHWDLWRTIPLAIGGALLCVIYEKTGSILVSALAHGTWNAIMAAMVYFTYMKVV